MEIRNSEITPPNEPLSIYMSIGFVVCFAFDTARRHRGPHISGAGSLVQGWLSSPCVSTSGCVRLCLESVLARAKLQDVQREGRFWEALLRIWHARVLGHCLEHHFRFSFFGSGDLSSNSGHVEVSGVNGTGGSLRVDHDIRNSCFSAWNAR